MSAQLDLLYGAKRRVTNPGVRTGGTFSTLQHLRHLRHYPDAKRPDNKELTRRAAFVATIGSNAIASVIQESNTVASNDMFCPAYFCGAGFPS